MSDKNKFGRRAGDDRTDVTAHTSAQNGSQDKEAKGSGLSARLIVTLVLSGALILSVFCFFIIQQLSATAASAATYLQIVTVITVGLCSALIIVNVILSSLEARGEKLETKKNLALSRFPVGLFRQISQPTAICEESSKLVWGNTAFCDLVSRDTILNGDTVSRLFVFERLEAPDDTDGTAQLPASTQKIFDYMLNYGYKLYAHGTPGIGRDWLIRAYRHVSNGTTFCLLVFTELTELITWRNRYTDDRMVCAYIVIDNLDELVSREHEAYRRASTDIDSRIKSWAQKYNAVIKEYDRDKYIMFFRSAELEGMKENKFSDILDKVREVRVGSEELPVTVSIGISLLDGTLPEKERSAQSALDVALRRGGNQVIINTATEMQCFGAKNLTVQNHSSVHYRVFAERLAVAMRECQRVLIMGHKNPDFDAIGSCVGIARLAISLGKEVYVVMDENDQNVSECIRTLRKLPVYENIFVSTLTGMDNNKDTKTLVICCDVNNSKQFEAPDIVANANTLFIIDHHRQNEFTPKQSAELGDKQKYEFLIVPSASSASELVSEMLRYALPEGCHLATEEADIMFAGILLDTKQFTRNAQADTFSAALYLRNAGADPTRAQAFFKTALDDFKREAGFGTNVMIEHDCVAISTDTERKGDASPARRVSAAKAADRLLNIRDIRASFVIAQMERDTFISARSDGSINVQLIMEALNGGGHYNAAATLMKDTKAEEALKQLREKIDKYLGETKKLGKHGTGRDKTKKGGGNLKRITDSLSGIRNVTKKKPHDTVASPEPIRTDKAE